MSAPTILHRNSSVSCRRDPQTGWPRLSCANSGAQGRFDEKSGLTYAPNRATAYPLPWGRVWWKLYVPRRSAIRCLPAVQASRAKQLLTDMTAVELAWISVPRGELSSTRTPTQRIASRGFGVVACCAGALRTNRPAVIRQSLRRARKRFCLRLIEDGLIRRLFRTAYDHSSFAMKGRFFARTCYVFEDGSPPRCQGQWSTRFLDKRVSVPLSGASLWRDWNCAVSLLGADWEVKETYAAILAGNNRPRTVFDVGANYGLHSLLFLTQGIRTISFEPNPHTVEHFQSIAHVNGVTPEVEASAVGEIEAEVQLAFDPKQTSYGSIRAQALNALQNSGTEYQTLRVPQITLDGFVARTGIQPDLIKIDVEGVELSVVRGAKQTLRSARPWVIFECYPSHAHRSPMAAFWKEMDYQVCRLPLRRGSEPTPLSHEKFSESRVWNFMAIPRTSAGGGADRP